MSRVPEGCQIYTPAALADAMVTALRGGVTDRWLEPSFGSGVFVKALNTHGVDRRLITAIDLDTTHSAVDDLATSTRGIDFLKWAEAPRQLFDRIVANPPYVALSKLSPELRATAAAAIKTHLGASDGTSNYWVPFVSASARLLSHGGAMAFVLPAAWEYAGYARKIREDVFSRFSEVLILRCRKPLFTEVKEGVIVLLAKGYGGVCAAPIRRDCRDLAELTSVLKNDAPVRLTEGHRGPAARCESAEIKFGDVFNVSIGAVTGDARFFLLTEDSRRAHQIPVEACVPVLSRSSHLVGASATRATWHELLERGERVWLFRPSPEQLEIASVDRYLKLPLESGGCDRMGFKVSNRARWYSCSLPVQPHGFLSGMAKFGPWISWNRMCGLSATNTLYVVRCRERLREDERRAWAMSLFTKVARESMSRLGRVYADGLRKFEPGDIAQIILKRPTRVNGASDAYRNVIGLLMNGDMESAIGAAERFYAACD